MFKYDAFISYRHVHPDMEIAQDIQRLIEAFVVSKAVPAVPKRRDFLVFRDRDELASGELGEAIENALENSAFLIVVCSRRTPLSPWCRREVEYFREVRDPSNIIAVLLEGEPEESFPPELRDVRKLVRTPGGAVQERRDEFLAADVRPDRVRAEGFPGYEEVERDPRALRALRRKSAALLKRTEINRIMATILGVSYGDITQRQRERKMRRAMALVSVVALVLGVFATTVTAMWVKSMRSEEKANERNAAITMSLATKAIADGDRLLGILYSRAAMSAADRSMGSYSRLQGEYYSNLSAATLYEDYTPTLEIKTDSGVPSFGQSASGGELVTAGRDASLTVWNARNGTPVRSIRLPSKPTKVGSARDGSSFYALTENNDLHLVSSGGGRIRTVRTGVAGQVANLVVWKDHAILDVGDGASEKVVGVDLAAGRRLFAMDLNKEGVVSVDVRDDGAEFAVAYAGGGASRHDARTGALSAWIAGRPAGAPSGASGSLARSELIHYAPRGNMLVYLSGSARVYYKADIIARIYALADWFSPADIEAPTLEWVDFFDRKTFKKLPIDDVPDLVFTEVMRDVDLVVSVAHVGGVDPEASHSTVEMRRAIVQYSLPLFHLTNVRLEGAHAHIHGTLGDYTVHLGSGVVQQKAGAMINVLPVHSQHRGRLFLPFLDEDPKTAEIVSKIVLFAEDGKIKDPFILEQIKR